MSDDQVSGWMFLLVPAYPGSPGQKAVKRLCVCVDKQSQFLPDAVIHKARVLLTWGRNWTPAVRFCAPAERGNLWTCDRRAQRDEQPAGTPRCRPSPLHVHPAYNLGVSHYAYLNGSSTTQMLGSTA